MQDAIVTKPREITPKEVEDARRRAVAGETVVMIGRALNRSPARIQSLLDALGITPAVRPRGRPRTRPVPEGPPKPRGRPRERTDDEIEEIRKLHASGVSVRRIGERMDPPRSGAWIWRILNPVNGTGEPKRYLCRECGEHFRSRARYGPERCARCGATDWRPPVE